MPWSVGRRAHRRVARAAVLALLVGVACRRAPTVRPEPVAAPVVVTDVAYRSDPFLSDVENRTFDYFWRTSDPRTGLTPDRSPSPSFSSIAAVGFALTAYPIGVAEGYVSREQAAQRAFTTLKYLYELPQGPADTGVAGYKGFFYHFLDMDTGHRFARVELSTIDTAILVAGALFCADFFDGPSAAESGVRAYADSLYRRVDWTWASPNPPAISLGWKPDSGFIQYDWRGYNEGMMLYVLALGSPTHPVPTGAWSEYTRTYRWEEWFGQQYLDFGPAFGHNYSQIWIDFRGIQDAFMRQHGIDYFENSRRAAYAQRAYAMYNPMGWIGYGPNAWGLSACDGPADTGASLSGVYRVFHSYWARGTDFTRIADDGTITPSAAGGLLPFAPEIAIPALKSIRSRYGNLVYSTYGFVDAYNPTFTLPIRTPLGRVDGARGWFDTDFLGIDEGPLLTMIENYRTEMIWTIMRRNRYIVRGLERAGFSGGWLGRGPPVAQ